LYAFDESLWAHFRAEAALKGSDRIIAVRRGNAAENAVREIELAVKSFGYEKRKTDDGKNDESLFQFFLRFCEDKAIDKSRIPPNLKSVVRKRNVRHDRDLSINETVPGVAACEIAARLIAGLSIQSERYTRRDDQGTLPSDSRASSPNIDFRQTAPLYGPQGFLPSATPGLPAQPGPKQSPVVVSRNARASSTDDGRQLTNTASLGYGFPWTKAVISLVSLYLLKACVAGCGSAYHEADAQLEDATQEQLSYYVHRPCNGGPCENIKSGSMTFISERPCTVTDPCDENAIDLGRYHEGCYHNRVNWDTGWLLHHTVFLFRLLGGTVADSCVALVHPLGGSEGATENMPATQPAAATPDARPPHELSPPGPSPSPERKQPKTPTVVAKPHVVAEAPDGPPVRRKP
jgi:hypothetical protein